ncbi:putative aminohydrolase SsnA [bacterium]|nr:putative aminohydrolase SsnA [bacterium]
MGLLIHNVRIFTNDVQNGLLLGQGVVVEESRIRELGPEPELREKYRHFQQLDGGGKLLMPGLSNAHMHFYGTFARGLALRQAPKNFAEILSLLWWKLDSALDDEAVYYSALVPAIYAIKNGVTSVIDHHASPQAASGSLDQIEEALKVVGLRAVLCYEVSDRDGNEIAQQSLEENERYIRKCENAKRTDPEHLFDGMIGLHASFTIGDDTLRRAAAMSRTLVRGCHIHLLEDQVDETRTEENFGLGVVERLHKYGILGNKTIAAHGIYLDDAEVDLLAQSDTMLIHNPQSNMNNAVGRADIFKLLRNGVLVGIGTDGMSADLKPDIRTAYLLHKHDLRDSNVGWAEIQQMTLRNNVKIFERVSGQKIGKVQAGYLADLILVDYFPPTPMNNQNFWGHFLFGIADAAIDTTIINGRTVMRNKQVSGVDEEKTAAIARQVAERVWKRFAS